jgi:polyphosphate:AMP phosphotransferase
MFADAELGHTIDKETFDTELPRLRTALLEAQFALRDKPEFPVIILIGGVDGAGRSETVNALTSWLDPRLVEVNGFGPATEEERQRPPFWRFWRALPPSGKLGIFFGSWYTAPIVDAVTGARRSGGAHLDGRISEIARFERMLTDEGALLLKFWFHLSKSAQRKRMRELAEDPATSWRVTKEDRARFKQYDQFVEVSERVLTRTSRPWAPWTVIEGTDRRYRELTTAQMLESALRTRLAATQPEDPAPALPPLPPSRSGRTVLTKLDLTASLTRTRYEKSLDQLQDRLAWLTRHKRFRDRNVVAVFEGNDAAGKGGAIRRVVSAVDARLIRVVSVAAPTDEERQHPYLWRFWRQLPRHGQIVVFDRSWYGRVLVERVEGFASPFDWQRAYAEINEFEDAMTASGTIVVKCWLAISKDEQLRRFRAREKTAFKAHKITPEDWRNRKRWPQYVAAVHEMVARTSTTHAPWTLVAANDKLHARVKVLEAVVSAVETGLDLRA